MAFIEWRETFSVGMLDIDQQHKRLVDIINRLHDAMRTGAAQPQLARVADDLLEYTKQHFAYEEKMIAAAGYPHVAEHAKKHRAMTAQVEAFRDNIRAATATVPLKLMEFLKNWLTQHILATDMDYSRVLSGAAGSRRT